MPDSTRAARALARRSVAERDGPEFPSSFAKTPESRRLMEEMIFHDRYLDGYSARTVLAGLNEARAVSAKEEKHCVGTTSLLCCAGIAIYDPSRKVAAAAHLLLPAAMPREPNPVSGLAKILADAISAADALGGSAYLLTAFNFRGGARDEQLSRMLCRKAEEIAAFLRRTGKLIGVRQRHERQFVLDSRTGGFYTGSEQSGSAG
ncbi:MAG: hypothetical protein AB1529_03770 [Candidatus Micrarchaeota archaeon]